MCELIDRQLRRVSESFARESVVSPAVKGLFFSMLIVEVIYRSLGRIGKLSVRAESDQSQI